MWGSRLISLMRKATGAGTHRGYGPASPPGVEVTARVEGVLTQSREGLGSSPDQVVGQGLLYNQCAWEVRGCGRDWRIGPDSVEGRDNITLPEQRARGPRWLLEWPEAGLVDNASRKTQEGALATKVMSNRKVTEDTRTWCFISATLREGCG